MFGIDAGEFLVIAIIAVIVIGPKDMPLALRTAGRWIGKMRKVSAHFRSGLDTMVREAELEDMQQKWKAQNEKIMRDHPDGVPTEMEPTGAWPPKKLPDVASPITAEEAERRRQEKRASAQEESAAAAAAAPDLVSRGANEAPGTPPGETRDA